MSLRAHFDRVADNNARARREWRGYHDQLLRRHRYHIPEGERVLEWGCNVGGLPAGLPLTNGLGVDFSSRMLDHAKKEHGIRPELRFREDYIQHDVVAEKLDHVILNYLAGYFPNIQQALTNLQHERTRLCLTMLTLFGGLPRGFAASLD